MADSDGEKPMPQLQPPGAGLPWFEHFIVRRILFPLTCWRQTWAKAGKKFQDEGAKVLALWDSTPSDKLTERVLVKRVPGLEDSSRYWSMAMAVEHLNVVGSNIRWVIGKLRAGMMPDRPASIEAVKPKGEIPPADVRAAFMKLLADAKTGDSEEPPIPPGAGPRFSHPWFGPIDAHQWHCLLGMHQAIHRGQMERIVKGL